jgi:hypothetical protein
MGDQVLSRSVHEDQYFEVLGAIALFFTSILFGLCFLISIRPIPETLQNWLVPFIFFVFVLLFLFGAGEEISWGQRVFGFQTPESLTSINRQNELTLHNLEIIDSGQFFSADRMFDIFWFCYAVLLPFAYLYIPSMFTTLKNLIDINTIAPHWSLGLLFLLNYFWAKVAKAIFISSYSYDQIPFQQAIQEIKESNYCIVFTLVGFYVYLNNTKNS